MLRVGGNRFVNSDQPFGLGQMQALGHAAFDADGALAGVFWQGVGGDHGLGEGEVRLGGRIYAVADLDLARVDQGLAVKAEVDALLADGRKTVVVVDVVIDPVEDGQVVGAGGGDRQAQSGMERFAPRRLTRAHFLGEIVGAHDPHGQTAG